MRSMLAPSPALIVPPDILLLESADALAVELAASFLAEESARGGAAAARYLESDPREYETWLGGALIGVRGADGSPAAGGGFRRYDTTTAELVQLWTRPELRRTGLARRVLQHLEPLALRAGYSRIYAVAEPGQGVMRHTLGACGYEALGGADLEYLGFVKALRTVGG
jgi:polar amino acid transport system permease protein